MIVAPVTRERVHTDERQHQDPGPSRRWGLIAVGILLRRVGLLSRILLSRILLGRILLGRILLSRILLGRILLSWIAARRGGRVAGGRVAVTGLLGRITVSRALT